MIEILKNLDWSPLIISLKTGVVATIISFILGIFAARKMMKAGPATKAFMDGINNFFLKKKLISQIIFKD